MIQGELMLQECRKLSDGELLRELRELSAKERVDVVRALARLAEMDRRELAERSGYPSLFLFCVKDLGYCEGTAYNRTRAADACAKFPELLALLENGELKVSSLAALAGHLTPQNFASLMASARGASRRDAERLAAGLNPCSRPPEKARVIAIAVPVKETRPEAPALTEMRSAAEGDELPMSGLSIEFRTEHTFTLSETAEGKFKRAKSIFEHALDVLLDRIDPSRQKDRTSEGAAPPGSRMKTRRIPNWVKRRVRVRDGDRCAYVAANGTRCGERRFLQFDHKVPWALGGRSDDPANVRQLCARHNQWLGRRVLEAARGEV